MKMLLLLIAAAIVAPVHTSPVTVCEALPLPGPDNTINPNAPVGQRRQIVLHICQAIQVPDPTHELSPYEKITDFKHDPRAFT